MLKKPDGRGYLYNMTFSKCKIIEKKNSLLVFQMWKQSQ